MTAAIQSRPNRRSRFALDIALEVQRQGNLAFFQSLWQRYGDLAHIQIGPRQLFLAVHPDHVRRITVEQPEIYTKRESYDGVREFILGEGLVASTGALWRRQRKLMAPFFTPR